MCESLPPCDSFPPMQSQQKPWPHDEQVICMQPEFFWIGVKHFGQGFVLEAIQFESFWASALLWLLATGLSLVEALGISTALKSLFSINYSQEVSVLQSIGWWGARVHPKQNDSPQPHEISIASPYLVSQTLPQSLPGHHFTVLDRSTNDLWTKNKYLSKSWGVKTFVKTASETILLHLASGHVENTISGPLASFDCAYPSKHSEQSLCPQSSIWTSSDFSQSQKQQSHVNSLSPLLSAIIFFPSSKVNLNSFLM